MFNNFLRILGSHHTIPIKHTYHVPFNGWMAGTKREWIDRYEDDLYYRLQGVNLSLKVKRVFNVTFILIQSFLLFLGVLLFISNASLWIFFILLEL